MSQQGWQDLKKFSQNAAKSTSWMTITALRTLIDYFKPFFKTIEMNALNVATAFNVTDKTTCWGRMTRFYLIPDGSFMYFWDRWMIFLAFVNGIILSFVAAFRVEDSALFGIAYFIDIMFYMDMYLKFHLAFLSNGYWIIDPQEMSKNYMKRVEFKFDVVSCVPTDIFILRYLSRDRDTRLFYLSVLRMNRWLRTFRMVKWFFVQDKKLHASYQLQIAKFVCFLSTFIHTVSCIWFYIGCPNNSVCKERSWVTIQGINRNDTSTRSMYIHSTYWAITTVTTTGYGDIRPDNDWERGFAALCMVCGTFFFAYASGVITSALANLDIRRVTLQQKVHAVLQYMRDRKVDTKYQRRVVEWYEYQWERNKGIDVREVFSDLPTSFKADVILHMNSDIIEKAPVFKKCSDAFKRTLATAMKITIFTANEYVVHKDDVGVEIYFIVKGRIDTFDEDILRPKASFIDGSCYGEINVILGHRHQLNARATINTDLYVITKGDLEDAFKMFPEDHELIKKLTEERFATYVLARKLRPEKGSMAMLASAIRSTGSINLGEGVIDRELEDEIEVIQSLEAPESKERMDRSSSSRKLMGRMYGEIEEVDTEDQLALIAPADRIPGKLKESE